MKATKLILAAAFVTMVAGCNSLSLPDNWKEQNIINMKNAGFEEAVENIDPAQNWNVASMNPVSWAKGITVTTGTDTKAWGGNTGGNTGGNNGGGTGTGSGSSSGSSSKSTESTAVGDYFVIAEGTTLPITFNTMSCWATQTIGLYYYDDAGEMVKVVLYENVSGYKYSKVGSTTTSEQTAEKNKVSGTKNVTINGGQCFGLYIVTHTGPDIDSCYSENEDHIWYSESSLNEDGIGHVQLRTVTTTTTTGKTKTTSYEYYFEFEDSYSGGAGSDADYNDVSLKLVGSYTTSWITSEDVDEEDPEDPFHPLITVDQDNGPWLILCEDLGTGADNDFNDIIFKVKRPSKTTMQLEYCASGATRPDYIFFGGNLIGEIHALMGVDIDWTQDYTLGSETPRPDWFINTKVYGGVPSVNETTWKSPVVSEKFTVDESFSMENFYSSSEGKGFSVKSDTMDEVPFSIGYTGYAPYIICVPAEGFRWPIECTSIFDAYPMFRGWAEDHTQNTDWYLYPVEELVVDLDECLAYFAE